MTQLVQHCTALHVVPRTVVRTRLLQAFGLGLLTIIACDDTPAPPNRAPTPSPAANDAPDAAVGAPQAWATPADPKIEWQDDGRFILVGTELEGMASSSGLDLRVAIFGEPSGTRVKFGNIEVVAEQPSPKLNAPLGPELGRLPPAQALDYELEAKLETKLELGFPDGGKVEVAFEALPVSGVKTAFENVGEGEGFDLGEDPEGHATYFEAYFGSGAEGLIVGDAPTLAHVDRVAIKREQPHRPSKKSCKARSGGTSPLVMQDWEVTVYDRASAEELAKKLFAAKDKCPPSWMEGSDAISRPETKPIERWLRRL